MPLRRTLEQRISSLPSLRIAYEPKDGNNDYRYENERHYETGKLYENDAQYYSNYERLERRLLDEPFSFGDYGLQLGFHLGSFHRCSLYARQRITRSQQSVKPRSNAVIHSWEIPLMSSALPWRYRFQGKCVAESGLIPQK